MKRILHLCSCNILLFTLFGLVFLFPFAELQRSAYRFSGTLTTFPVLLPGYIVICPVLARKNLWRVQSASELAHADEREQTIVARSTKAASQALIGGLLLCIAALGGVGFFTQATGATINVYAVPLVLLTMLLDVATATRCVRWRLEYCK